MTNPLVCASARRIAVLLGVGLFACTMDNPAFDQTRDEVGGTAEGDGDGDDSTVGDGDGEPTSGDGDGEPTSGDGDGEPTSGDGDGDGDAESSTGDGDGDPPECGNDGKELCNGSCVDTKFDNLNCGMCGQACADTEICGQGNCLHKKYVFVTTELLPGSFGGLDVAKSLCNQLAGPADLPGTYMPWLSNQNTFPAQIVAPVLAAYVLPKGPVIAWSWPDFITNQHLAAINHNQWGSAIEPTPACEIDYAVWTGTSDTGMPLMPNCGGWETSQGLAVVGDAQHNGPGWSASECEAACELQLPVYCVQE